MLSLALAAIGLLVWSPGTGSHAQQEPNRQLVQTASASASAGKRIALVIGNGAYTKAPPLKNPPNDARDMAATLRALGFDVTNGINVNQRDMKRLIREFGQKLKAGGSGLFYYAGHGVQSKGRNYLIPVDADIQSEAEVEDAGVDASLVLNYMDDAQNVLNIVILDACRNNPFSRSFRSASDGLAQVDAPTGTLIAYATAPGRVASDGIARNGLYTSELLKQMRVPGLGVTEMFMRVRAEVMKQTGNKQVPWEASSLVGSFYFSGGASSTGSNSGANNAAPSETRFDAAAFEYSYWETIKNSNNSDDFQAYLDKYPDGQFTALAKNKIKNLEASAKPADSTSSSANSAAAELAFWDAIKNSTKGEDFEAYLKKYPNGEFAYPAKNRLTDLETAARQSREEADRRAAAQRQADEIARKTVTFKGSITWSVKHVGTWYSDLTLTVSPGKLSYVCGAGTGNFCGETSNFECFQFASAVIDGSAISEITDKYPQNKNRWKFRFNAASPAEAARALGAIREVCKPTP
jgi:uncharacterized caspase-like protein